MFSRQAAKRAGGERLVFSILQAAAAVLMAAGLLSAQSQAPMLDTLKMPNSPPVPAPATLTPERRGDILMVQKKYREAIETYREAPANSAVVQNKIGIAYHQLTQLGTAKRYYQQAVKLDARYAEALNNIGTIYYAQKSYGRAISYYQKALKVSPESAAMFSNLGTAYFARKKYKQAFEAYQTALKLDPNVFEQRNTFGVLLEDRSVEERAKYHYYLARTYAKAGMNDRALQYLRKAIEEGFKERRKIEEDPEFAHVRAMPEFQELLKLEPRAL